MNRRRRQSPTTFPGLVASGRALPVLPTTDSGFVQYGAGRLFLPAATNYCTNPSLEAATSGFADGWTHNNSSYSEAAPVHTQVTGRVSGYAQRVTFTAGGFYTSFAPANFQTADGTFAAGDFVTFSAYLKGVLTSCTASLRVRWYTDADVYISESNSSSLTLDSGTFNRFSLTTPALGAGSGYVVVSVVVSGLVETDSFDITIDDVQIEKSAVLTPYGDGSYSGWSWSGAAHASTSVRAASSLIYALPTPLLTNGSLTFGCRNVPLWAGNDGVSHYLATFNAPSNLDLAKAANRWYCYPTSGTQPLVQSANLSFAAGTSHAVIYRQGPGILDLMSDGTAATQVTNTAGSTALTDTRLAPSSSWLYVGPVLISPTRITDAQTATLSAMLTAGATGLDLARWCIANGLTNSLVLPLQSDSVGYVIR